MTSASIVSVRRTGIAPSAQSHLTHRATPVSGVENGRTLAKPPLGAATWSARRLARATPNWIRCVRSLRQPNGGANALDLPMSAHTRRDGPGCRSTGRLGVAATRSATRTGPHVRSTGAAPRPGSGRCADPRCQTAAKASPALALRAAFDQTPSGTSPPAISLAEHRVEFGVGPDLPDLLRAPAGDGDLGSPFQRLLA